MSHECAESSRRSGRTHRMVCEVVAWLNAHPTKRAVIVTHSSNMFDVINRMLDCCLDEYNSQRRVRIAHVEVAPVLLQGTNARAFIDHAVIETATVHQAYCVIPQIHAHNARVAFNARPKTVDRNAFDLTIGRLDRLLSEFLALAKAPLDEADRQTIKHHADDLIGVGRAALAAVRS